MAFTLFLTAAGGPALSDIHVPLVVARTHELLGAIAGARNRIVHVPTVLTTRDPFLHIDPPPVLVIEARFDDIASAEAAMSRSGALAQLCDVSVFPALAGCDWSHQLMAVRRYASPSMLDYPSRGPVEQFTYLVAYEGSASDDVDWLSCYVRQHPPIMTRLPAVREVEVYSRVDFCSDLPMARASALQRNKVVFDSASALARALTSPIRHELRRDFESLPVFRGASPHHPMRSFSSHP